MSVQYYTVKITQTLEGYVQIQARSEAEALFLADFKYNNLVKDLPTMEENSPLLFDICK